MSSSSFCPKCGISLHDEQNFGYWLSLDQLKYIEDLVAFQRGLIEPSFIGQMFARHGTPLGYCSNNECRFLNDPSDDSPITTVESGTS